MAKIKKVKILSHWTYGGVDVIGKELELDTEWLDSIKIAYEVIGEVKGK
jgi:hypothetical protein